MLRSLTKALEFSPRLLPSTWTTRLESVCRICTSTTDLGRTQWSYTRPRHTNMKMSVPSRLLDRDYYRNQSKGGRCLETGRVVQRHIGGGHQRNFRIIDKLRVPVPRAGEPPHTITDRVLHIGYDPFRSGNIALLAGNGQDQVKLVLAPHELAPGDVITASRDKPKSLLHLKPGDAYPLEHMPYGTMVHAIENEPGSGAASCTAAGTYRLVIKKTESEVILRNPRKKTDLLTVSKDCLAVVGRVSNIDHDQFQIGKAGRARWMNQRPKGKTGKARRFNQKKGGSQASNTKGIKKK